MPSGSMQGRNSSLSEDRKSGLERSDSLLKPQAARPGHAERLDARQKKFQLKEDRVSGLERSDRIEVWSEAT
jgi:hypothetical protein